jgi:hypothetical protein
MNSEKQNRRKQQRGVAMVMAILAVFVLAIIGMAFMAMTTTENSANRNYKDSQKAYFASRAGLENVRAMLWNDANFQAQVAALGMPSALNPNGIIYALNPTGAEVIDPKANPTLDNELCNERFTGLVLGNLTPVATPGAPCGTGAGTELMPAAPNYYQLAVLNAGDIPNAGTASALPFKWVRITNKQNLMGLMNTNVDGTQAAGNQVCWDGSKEVVMAAGTTCAAWTAAHTLNQVNPVWLLTSLAITPAGSRRMAQMEVAFTPPLYPDGAVVAEAPITIRGSLDVNGFDNCNCTPTGGDRPGMHCNNTAVAIASHNTVDTKGSAASITAGPNPPIAQSVDPWPYKVGDLINTYSSGATNVTGAPYNTTCTGTPNFTSTPAVYASCSTVTGQVYGTYPTGLPDSPTGSNPQTTYIPGSVRLDGNTTGSGVLIIDGDLDVHGGLNFYGLILVRGQINFTGGGSQSVNLYGALLAGQDVNAQDIALGDNIGGSFNFHYDSCALKQSAPPGPPRLLATHEVMY